MYDMGSRVMGSLSTLSTRFGDENRALFSMRNDRYRRQWIRKLYSRSAVWPRSRLLRYSLLYILVARAIKHFDICAIWAVCTRNTIVQEIMWGKSYCLMKWICGGHLLKKVLDVSWCSVSSVSAWGSASDNPGLLQPLLTTLLYLRVRISEMHGRESL